MRAPSKVNQNREWFNCKRACKPAKVTKAVKTLKLFVWPIHFRFMQVIFPWNYAFLNFAKIKNLAFAQKINIYGKPKDVFPKKTQLSIFSKMEKEPHCLFWMYITWKFLHVNALADEVPFKELCILYVTWKLILTTKVSMVSTRVSEKLKKVRRVRMCMMLGSKLMPCLRKTRKATYFPSASSMSPRLGSVPL